jgi:hypothetical protein
MAQGDEMIGQGPGFVARPGVEGGHELRLLDQAVLKSEQPEQQMAVGGGHASVLRSVGGVLVARPGGDPNE